MWYRFLFFFLLSVNVHFFFGQSWLSTNGKAIVNANGDTVILKAMNLGGWMLIEPYQIQAAGFASAQWEFEEKVEQLIGTAAKDSFLNNWYANHVRKVDIDSLASWGFNSIRLPMHYNLFTLSIQEEPIQGQNTWLTKGFEMTDSLVSWCKQNNMYVILDLHAAPGGQGGNTGISDYNPAYPSLWESNLNKNKTFSLWRKIAEHYQNEPAIAGYDYLNEVNWNLGNNELRNFYMQLTDSVRSVDQNHIIFIEGNWYANDFSGLTPPWDSNMVYSPHKYWSENYQVDIQWVLDIRNTWNVPLWFGESGENSNVWFRDAIRLIEDHDIGWAWWPMKKLESISCPMSVTKTIDFQNLLDYWSGGSGMPSATYTTNTLNQLTEDLKLENCHFQKDVIDAMFRQVNSNQTIPFDSVAEIPGRIYATDFDLGVVGEAYQDNVVATYQVTTGNYTPWNNGWMYRNDGADISACNDVYLFHNGYQVGWFEQNEWMQYEVNVDTSAVYDINIRYSANNPDSKIYFSLNDTAFTSTAALPNTNNWSFWNTVTVSNAMLSAGNQKIRLHCDEGEININSFEFVKSGTIDTLSALYLSGETIDQYRIKLLFNKPIDNSSIPASILSNPNQVFDVYTDSTQNMIINNLQFDPANPRYVTLVLNSAIQGFSPSTGQPTKISVSYNGTQLSSTDGNTLSPFAYRPVKNTISCSNNCIPGIIQAEDYFNESGIGLEGCSDIGGGQNIGYLHPGDYVDYYINAIYSGSFQVSYRNASNGFSGGLELQLIDSSGGATTLNQIDFSSTGGWQTWQTTTASEVFWLDKGIYHVRILITGQEFNLNWFEFNTVVSDELNIANENDLVIYPNPTDGQLHINSNQNETHYISIYDLSGRLMLKSTSKSIDISPFDAGIYLVNVKVGDYLCQQKIIKN